jgi:hypothetical protein
MTRLPLTGRCAIGGAVGFTVGGISWPLLVWGLVLLGMRDFPDSAFNVGTITFLCVVGAIAAGGVALALPAGTRRVLMLAQGALGFGVAGVFAAASGDLEDLGRLAVAAAIVGVFFGLRTPLGVLFGGLVGASTFAMGVALTMGGGWLSLVPYLAGLAMWGAALGATVGTCETSPGWDVVARPAVLLGALGLLLPAQLAAVLFGPRRHPPALCVDARKVPGGAILAVADLDGDGDLDGLQRTDGGLGLLRNAGGELTPEPGPSGLRVSRMATGDVDGDGDTDAVAVFFDRELPQRTGLVVARNDGRGSFSLGPRVALDTEPLTLWVVDLDGDRAADVLVPGRVYWSRGDRLERGPVVPEWKYAVVGDVDGDGRDDVVSFGGGYRIEVNRLTAPARFESSTVPVPGYVNDAALADVDGDGDLDLLLAGHRKVTVLANEGGGRFSAAKTLPGGRDNSFVTGGDLDGDGDLDVVTGVLPADEFDGGVWAWENKGADGWSDGGHVGRTVERLVAADLTGDGRADLVPGNRPAGSLSSTLLLARAC